MKPLKISKPRMASMTIGILAIALAGGASPASATCYSQTQIDVRADPNSTACGVWAVNVDGNAQSNPDANGQGGVAVSGTGQANSGYAYDNDTCEDYGCFAISGTGPATTTNGTNSCHGQASCMAISGTGPATTQTTPDDGAACWPNPNETKTPGANCIAVSGTGKASNTSRNCSQGVGAGAAVSCVAVSGTNDASNTAGCSGSGLVQFTGVACLAASGTGEASNSGYCNGQASCVAVSGTGDATNTETDSYDACGFPLGGGGSNATSLNVDCVAISGTGRAANTGSYGCTGNPNEAFHFMVTCIAVSGNQASNTAPACTNGSVVRPGDTSLDIGCIAIGPGLGALPAPWATRRD